MRALMQVKQSSKSFHWSSNQLPSACPFFSKKLTWRHLYVPRHHTKYKPGPDHEMLISLFLNYCLTTDTHKQLNNAGNNKTHTKNKKGAVKQTAWGGRGGEVKALATKVWQGCIPWVGSHFLWKCAGSVSQRKLGTARSIPITSTTNPSSWRAVTGP